MVGNLIKGFLKNKKGTAEVIGTVMFIVILLFFFTNVYLWHDAATKQMNDLQLKKMNAGMEVTFIDGSATITAKGSDVVLSRIWIVTSNNQHLYADLSASDIHLVAGKPTSITFGSQILKADGSIQSEGNSNGITLHYPSNSITKLSVMNTLGIVV
jgi:hypothetical protein